MKAKQGMTLVELLVVVAIIGIFASVVLVSYNEVRARGRASHVLQQLEQIDKAMKLYMIHENISEWPVDSPYNGKTINQLRSMLSGFDKYVPELPKTKAFGNGDFVYRSRSSNGDRYSCNTDGNSGYSSGVSIRVGELKEKDARVWDILDQTIDEGDGIDCGRMQTYGSSHSLYYSLSKSYRELDSTY